MSLELFTYKNLYTSVHRPGPGALKDSITGLFSEQYLTKDNTPSMPLFDAHLGGFFFYSHIQSTGTCFYNFIS